MKLPNALTLMIDPVALARHLQAIETDLRAMTWRPILVSPKDGPEHDVVSFSGEVGEGLTKRLATVVGYTLPGQLRRIDGAFVAITGEPAITHLTPELAQIAFELASAATSTTTEHK